MLEFIQVGDLGKNRDSYLNKVSRVVGKDNWYWAFRVKKKLYSWEFGFQLYEDAVWEYLKSKPLLLESLILNYSDVFSLNRFDTESVLDYKKQTQNSDHYNDIAIRRCLVRFGVWFQGKDLLNLAKTDYCEKHIPFHLPHLIESENKSIKSWLDNNRYIVIAKEVEDLYKFKEILVK